MSARRVVTETAPAMNTIHNGRSTTLRTRISENTAPMSKTTTPKSTLSTIQSGDGGSGTTDCLHEAHATGSMAPPPEDVAFGIVHRLPMHRPIRRTSAPPRTKRHRPSRTFRARTARSSPRSKVPPTASAPMVELASPAIVIKFGHS